LDSVLLMAEFQSLPPAAFDAITRRTEQRMQGQLLAVAARYDARRGQVMVSLNNGMVVGFPPALLPGLEAASADDLRKIEVEGLGYGLRVAALDVDISIPQLMADQLGSTRMTRAVSRAQASKANGRLGGRPRKTPAA
jgi:hypothetical protein